jgi:hypothetical protein
VHRGWTPIAAGCVPGEGESSPSPPAWAPCCARGTCCTAPAKRRPKPPPR